MKLLRKMLVGVIGNWQKILSSLIGCNPGPSTHWSDPVAQRYDSLLTAKPY